MRTPIARVRVAANSRTSASSPQAPPTNHIRCEAKAAPSPYRFAERIALHQSCPWCSQFRRRFRRLAFDTSLRHEPGNHDPALLVIRRVLHFVPRCCFRLERHDQGATLVLSQIAVSRFKSECQLFVHPHKQRLPALRVQGIALPEAHVATRTVLPVSVKAECEGPIGGRGEQHRRRGARLRGRRGIGRIRTRRHQGSESERQKPIYSAQ
jgi:hypothetical protein